MSDGPDAGTPVPGMIIARRMRSLETARLWTAVVASARAGVWPASEGCINTAAVAMHAARAGMRIGGF
jgi:hypothetical protein